MADEKLYESAAVWDQELQLGQRNLIQAICDHWPKGIRTALDVGCGDGKITHTLAERVNTSFHGFDGSREALSRLRLPSTHGDVSALPFDDDAFDVVLTTDVFEHLPDQVEQVAWQELFRVARGWVFFAVPFREELLDASTICTNCGEQYHVNWHHRGYDLAGLSNRTPPDWRLVRAVLSGERWSPMLPPETHYRRLALNEWSGWTEAVCPACGAPGQPPVEPSALAADVARALGQYIYDVASERRFLRSHSEILVIFCRSDLPLENDAPPTCDTERISAAQWVSRLGVANNLDPYPQTARMVSAVGGGYVAQFPVYPGSLPLLSFAARRIGAISIVVEDGTGLVFSGDVDLFPDTPTRVPLPCEVRAGYYGLIVRLPSIDFLESITLEGKTPSVSYVFPHKDGTNYCHVPGTTICIQVTDHLWIDYESLVSSSLRVDQIETSAVRALVRAETGLEDRIQLARTVIEQRKLIAACEQEATLATQKCDDLAEQIMQQQLLIDALTQDKDGVGHQLSQLNHEELQLQSSYEQLKLELEQFKERTEVRFGDWMRRTLRAHRKSKGA